MNVTNTSGAAINVDGQITIPSGATNFYIPDEESLYTRVIKLASSGKLTFSAGSSNGIVTVSNFPSIQPISGKVGLQVGGTDVSTSNTVPISAIDGGILSLEPPLTSLLLVPVPQQQL